MAVPVRRAAMALALWLPIALGQVNTCFVERFEPPSSSFFPLVERFGLSLFSEVASRQSTGSVFLSPYSVWSALTLAYFGSAGATKQQLENVMRFSSKTGAYYNWRSLDFLLQTRDNEASSGVRLKSSNTAYFSDKLQMKQCIKIILLKELQIIDFTNSNAARTIINNNVKNTTEGRITDLIQFLPPQTNFALVNAIFFKGLWEHPFDPVDTIQQEFLIPPGVRGAVVDMMMQEVSLKYAKSNILNASIVEVPYTKSNISMYLLLPESWSTDTILRRLSDHSLNETINTMVVRPIKLGLPKFKITTRIEDELKTALNAMGIEDLFLPGLANLTEFTSASLNVDAAIHQATVEITEEGTVAAAATGLINTRFGGPPIPFICNRPFVFFIRDKFTGITLFAGNVINAEAMKSV